jgi:uncharacterized protein (TIGR03435 family)
VAQNTSLKRLVMFAFRMTEDQIVGGPDWVSQDVWNIDAKWPAGASQAQVPEMLQQMLADRFHLTYHRETRMLPTYDLIVAKTGSKLHASEATQAGMTGGSTALHYTGGTISQLAAQLSNILKRKAEDKTGFSGRYDMDLSFAPVAPNPSVDAALTETRPSIFAAIEQQLGLRLDATNGPTEVLVIDRAEKASEN